jgi:hypothetical protein
MQLIILDTILIFFQEVKKDEYCIKYYQLHKHICLYTNYTQDMMSMFCLAVISKSGSSFSTCVVLTCNNSKNKNISNIRLWNENINFFSGR